MLYTQIHLVQDALNPTWLPAFGRIDGGYSILPFSSPRVYHLFSLKFTFVASVLPFSTIYTWYNFYFGSPLFNMEAHDVSSQLYA